MSKSFPICVIAVLSLFAAFTQAQDASPQDQALFDRQISKLVKVTPKPIDDDSLAAVFAAKFYNVELHIGDGSMETLLVARVGDDLTNVSLPSTTMDMPALAKLVKPDFKIKSDSNAKDFENALDALFPITDSDDIHARKIKHSKNEWTFIRGKFFEHFKGFVVTTSDDGSIQKIEYSLDIQ